ncbi:MAG: glycosyltransferase family 4 protein [Reichenbachiella sp.]
MTEKKILFFTPYPRDTAGSQRFRFEQYYEALENAGFKCEESSFIGLRTWKILYLKGKGWEKFWRLVLGFIRRKTLVNLSWRYDFVFIHRELAPVGPPFFEWWMAKVLRRKVIYDFDDSIWMQSITNANSIAVNLKWHSKVKSICKWSYKISCGNQFLVNYASQFNDQVFYNPTTIDTVSQHVPRSTNNEVPVIGWTGTHSTLKYLALIAEPLRKLAEKQAFIFRVIADEKPSFDIPNMQYKPWSKESEIDDLNGIDIGVMPLEDNDWSKGKCGFKALQFMALEKPVLVSPVGVNDEIVEEEVSGFHCFNEEDWVNRMEQLLLDAELRTKLGKEGRKKVEAEFSVKSNTKNFLSLFI